MSSSTPYYSASNARPVVVQGKPLSQTPQVGYDHKNSGAVGLISSSDPTSHRQGGCRDAFWAVLFYAHLGFLGIATFKYVPDYVSGVYENVAQGQGGRFLRSLQDNNDGEEELDIDPSALLGTVGVSAIIGLLLSTFALSFMSSFAETLIKIALWFNILVFGLMGLAGVLTGSIEMGLMGFMLCGFSAYYAYRVWARIPFAASNLVTAVAAVRQNLGLAFYAYWSVILLFVWTLWWAVTNIATLYVVSGCDADGQCESGFSGPLVFAFILSFYWTAQVISNVVHVTTAGTVAEWWYDPISANGCCSSAVRNSYVRSLTTSFGSICLGSLIVAIIQTLRRYFQSLRENGDSFLACCAECLIGCIENLVEYFNKWAFVFVAIHGFSFMEAGKNAMALFRQRGWTAIISDMMVDSVLSLVSLGIGLITGLLALAFGVSVGLSDGPSMLFAFFLGLVVGCKCFSSRPSKQMLLTFNRVTHSPFSFRLGYSLFCS